MGQYLSGGGGRYFLCPETDTRPQPDLAAFSVTMPQYLVQCQEMVGRLKACYPDLKIAVGGNAFQSLSKIQGNWRIDVYAGMQGNLCGGRMIHLQMRYDWLSCIM